MMKSELYKHVHPEVLEHLLLTLEPASVLAGTVSNLVEAQHFEAASQVSKQLLVRVGEFQALLKDLETQAMAHAEKLRSEAEAKPDAPVTAAETPAPVATEAAAQQ